jgi:orotidine-5'-phosphate decarboxylase
MKLCIALDLPSAKENLALLEDIKDVNGIENVWIKVGLRAYIRDGKEFISQIKSINSDFKIFLDLKLYDIPNTMADTAEEITKIGVDMFNIHASAGKIAMKTVMDRISSYDNKPIVLAVTALTSFDEENFQAIYNQDITSKATQFAKDSYEAGLDGVVCSVYESLSIKQNTSDKFLTLTPGVRPFGENSDDQQRVANLDDAQENKSDFIVIGRPIYKSDNPKEIVEKIISNI